MIFRPAIFACCCSNVASHLCCYFGGFCFFRVLGGLTHHNFRQRLHFSCAGASRLPFAGRLASFRSPPFFRQLPPRWPRVKAEVHLGSFCVSSSGLQAAGLSQNAFFVLTRLGGPAEAPKNLPTPHASETPSHEVYNDVWGPRRLIVGAPAPKKQHPKANAQMSRDPAGCIPGYENPSVPLKT